MNSSAGWLLLAVVAPVALVLGYRKLSGTDDPPRPAYSAEAAADQEIGRAVRSAFVPATPSEALQDIDRVQVEVSATGEAREVTGFEPGALKTRLEGRLRQARVRVEAGAPTVVKLVVFTISLEPRTQFSLAANITVQRVGCVLLPSTGKFMSSQSVVWRTETSGTFGILRTSDARAAIDGLTDTLLNDLLRANPGR